MLGDPASHADPPEETEPPELSPLWGLTLVLGEIAQRVDRRRADERDDRTRESDDNNEGP